MKSKFQVEYSIHSTTKLIFPKVSTPLGLEQWFAEKVEMHGNLVTFIWGGVEQTAVLTSIRENQNVRFDWKDDPEKSYFEFRIKIDELTNDLALIVTDFAEESDKSDAIELWDVQVANLKHVLGLYND